MDQQFEADDSNASYVDPAADRLPTSSTWLDGIAPELIRDLQHRLDHLSSGTLVEADDIEFCRALFVSRSSPSASTSADVVDPTQSRETGADHRERSIPHREATANPYRWGEILGAGAFGIVVQVYDPRFGLEFALKILRPSLLHRRRLVERFLREGRAASILNHPGIVKVCDTGTLAGIPYIVSQLVDGPDLKRYLVHKNGKMPVRQAAQLSLRLAEAVHHAHTRGVLHRDIKPSNILLDSKGEDEKIEGEFTPRLTDFGLAKQLDADDSLTEDQQLIGTVRYMSPEQTYGSPYQVSTGSDVYSLGVVLYELLVGHVPFLSSGTLETLRRVREERPVRPRKLRPEVPQDLEAIVLQCLCKNPEDRYSSASALADDLRRFLEGAPVQAARPSALKSAIYWVKTRPSQAALIFVIVLVVFLASVLSTAAWQREKQQHQRAEANLQAAIEAVAIAVLPFADKLNDGVTISHEDHLEFLRSAVTIHEQLIEQKPLEPALRHRLSVLYHYLANASFRMNAFEDAARYRRQCLEILLELLDEDPENEKFLYQCFMAHLLLSSDRSLANPETSNAFKQQELDEARRYLERLLSVAPENVNYADAYNALRIELAAGLKQESAALRPLVESAIASSIKLWRENPEEPRLAKHAIRGHLMLAGFGASPSLNLEEVIKGIRLFEEVFPEPHVEKWVIELRADLHCRYARVAYDLGDRKTAIETARLAIALEEQVRDFRRPSDSDRTLYLMHSLLVFALQWDGKTDEMESHRVMMEQLASQIDTLDPALQEWERELAEIAATFANQPETPGVETQIGEDRGQ